MALEDLLAAWAGGEPWASDIAEWSRARESTLPELTRLIDRFESGELGVVQFSRSLDRLSKRENLWGFRGHSGQMFFNMLLRAADHMRLEDALREVIGVPTSEADAERRLELFSQFVLETRERATRIDRYPPKAGYVPYFLSFFWEARNLDWPIYYPRSREALVRHGLFRELGSLGQRYVFFRAETMRLRKALGTSTWGVEVFLFRMTADEDAAGRTGRVIGQRPVELVDDLYVRDITVEADVRDDVEPLPPVSLLVDELAATNERISETRAASVGAQRDLNAYLEALSLGVDTGAAPLPRFIELALYVDGGDAEAVEQAVVSLGAALGFVVVDEFPAVRRSWLRRWTARSRLFMTKAELDDRLRELERAVQIRELDAPQSEVDAALLQAVGETVAALEGYDTASIRAGSIVVLKNGSDLRVRGLTPVEMHRISRDPTAFAFDDERPPDTPAL